MMDRKKSLKDQVFCEFLLDPSLGPTEMTEKLNAKYNSVKAAFAKLAQEGMLERPSRGVYAPNVPNILLHILDRIEVLENQNV